MSKRPLASICAASIAFCLHGCSFLFVEAAPADHATRPYFTCTSSQVAPIFDTIGAATYGLGALGQTVVSSATDTDLPLAITVFNFALAATLGASAANGYTTTSECSDATAALYNRQRIPMSPLAPVNQPPVAPAPPAPTAPYVPPAPTAPIPPHEAPVLLFGEPTPPAPVAPPVPVAPPAPPTPQAAP